MLAPALAWVLRHPRQVIALWLLFAIVAALGVLRLHVDFASTSFYGDDDRSLGQLEAFQSRWGPDDRTLVVVVTGDDLLSESGLGRLGALERHLASVPAVHSTRSLASIPVPGYDGALANAWPLLPPDLRAAARRELLDSPAVPLLLSAQGDAAAVLLELTRSTDDLAAAVTTVGEVEAALDEFERGELELQLAGVPAIRASFFSATLADQLRLGPLALLVAAAGLFVGVRRIGAPGVAALGAGVPVLLTAGAMGWAEEPVGLLNQALFTMLPIIAVADTVHVVMRVRATAAARGLSATTPEVIAEAMQHVGWACLLTTATTAIGFGSMLVADLPLLRHFGIWAALGVTSAYAVVMTLTPVVLLRVDVGRGHPSGSHRLRALATRCTNAPGRVVLAAVGLTVLAVPAARSVVVDNHLGALLDDEHPVRRAGARLDADLGGTLTLEIELTRRDQTPWRADDPLLGDTVARLQHIPQVLAVVGPTLDVDRARLSVRVPDVGGRAFEALERDATDRLVSPHYTALVTGTAAVAYRGVNRITAAVRTSLVVVLAVVVTMIGLVFRSPSLAVRSVLPNVLPLLFGYAAVGLVGLELDPIGAVILAVALGIAVDDTLHVLAAFDTARRRGSTPRAAAIDAVATSGHAIVITSGVLVAGLAVNLLSSFPPLRTLGGLGSAVIAFAMLADVTLLPALLVWGRSPTAGPETHRGSESPAAGPD